MMHPLRHHTAAPVSTPASESAHNCEPLVLENRELMELFMPMLRADFKMVDDYCSGTRGAGRQAGKLPAGQVRLSYAGYVWSQRKARRWTALSHPCLARTT